MLKLIFALAISAAVSIVGLGPAYALNTRTWISGTGVDQAGCGPIANPCRTLQYAHNQTAANGEINVKDSAGYGALSITKSISIVAEGVMAGVLPSPQNSAVTIEIGQTDTVTLRGLTIEGANVGISGISVQSGGTINISRCVIANFLTDGITISTGGTQQVKVVVDDVDSTGNFQGAGVRYLTSTSATDRIVIRNSRLNFNAYGAELAGNRQSIFLISNSAALNNTQDGFYVSYGGIMTVDGVTASGNKTGVRAFNGTLLLGRSTVVSNTSFGVNAESVTALSYRNNQINGNGVDVSGTLTTAPQL